MYIYKVAFKSSYHSLVYDNSDIIDLLNFYHLCMKDIFNLGGLLMYILTGIFHLGDGQSEAL